MPEIIEIKDLKTKNLVELSSIDFVKLIESLDSKFIFKDIDNYYEMREGFCYFTYHFNLFESFNQFVDKAREAEKAGFNRIDLYESSRSFGEFESEEEYVKFSNGGFSPHYDKFIEAKKRGFSNYQNFKEAELLEIREQKDFVAFKKSEYYVSSYAPRIFQSEFYTYKHELLNKEAYEKFKKKQR